ncbi:hypothetical protein ACWJJH_17615 [Endozoicomonadaceae bacterium StTr2]
MNFKNRFVFFIVLLIFSFNAYCVEIWIVANGNEKIPFVIRSMSSRYGEQFYLHTTSGSHYEKLICVDVSFEKEVVDVTFEDETKETYKIYNGYKKLKAKNHFVTDESDKSFVLVRKQIKPFNPVWSLCHADTGITIAIFRTAKINRKTGQVNAVHLDGSIVNYNLIQPAKVLSVPSELQQPEKHKTFGLLRPKKKSLPGYHEQPDLLKRDLKRLDAKSPHSVDAFSVKIRKAITALKAQHSGADMAAQDWMFSLFKQVSFDRRDLALIAKLRQIDTVGFSNPHLNSLRMFMNMEVAIDLLEQGPRPVDHNDVARMDKSGDPAENKQAIALRARTSWMAQASPSELRRLSRAPEKINLIVDCVYDMREKLAMLRDAIAVLPGGTENRQLRAIHSRIEILMGDKAKRKDDFAVSTVLHVCREQLSKLAISSAADEEVVNFAQVWVAG